MKTQLIILLFCFLGILGFSQSITEVEYYFNTDPGFGNATSVMINSNVGSVTQSYSIPLPSDMEGFNTLYVRVKDADNVWSLYDRSIFYVYPIMEEVPEITMAEYFFDTDPGLGNGTPVPLVSGRNAENTIDDNDFTVGLGTTEISCGIHNFYLRLQNTDGTWSLYDLGQDVEVLDDAAPTIVVFPNVTAELDASGEVSITIDDVNNGTYDDCQLVSVVMNQVQFDYTCANLGVNNVTITATDAEDKVTVQNVMVTIVDTINPTAIGQDITIDLGGQSSISIAAGDLDNGSSDNCGFGFDVNQDTFTFPGLYPVILTVTDSSGNEATANVNVTVTDSTLGLDEDTISENAIKVFPVPTRNIIKVISNLDIEQTDVFDVNGRNVLKIKGNSREINLSDFSTGVYFVKFMTANQSITKRIIKQ